MPQIQTANYKKPRKFRFLGISCNLCVFSKDLVAEKIKQVQQGTSSLSGRLLLRSKRSFFKQEALKLRSKMAKAPNCTNFPRGIATFVKFPGDLMDQNV